MENVLADIRQRAPEYDISGKWPTEDLAALEKLGAMRWAIDLPALELHLKYEEVAAASLATALILTQRDSAVGLIAASEGAARRSVILERLANNKSFATIGIAQLTTSRQGGAPALSAHRVEGGYELNGLIPWCTGAANAQFIVAGATIEDGNQILFLLDPHLPGVSVDHPMKLVALRSTHTSSVVLKNVHIDDRLLLRPPGQGVLGNRRGSLVLGQTFLAMGLTRGASELIAAHRSEPARMAQQRLEHQLNQLHEQIVGLSASGREAEAAAANAKLRGECNELALRAAHIAVTLYKGTALLADHPAQRLAREALFLLVWSCPNPVIDCTVDLLSSAC